MPVIKYKLRLLKIAEEDFTEIISYIASDNPGAAEAIAGKIEKSLELLADNPLFGRVPRDEDIGNLGYRYFIVQKYIIIYIIEEKTIFVHRKLHGARDYKKLL